MPALTLHLLALTPGTDAQSFLQQLMQAPNVQVVVASRPRYVVIHPTSLDANPLATQPWDLLVLLQLTSKSTDSNNDKDANPIPAALRPSIRIEYKITTGIPSKLLSTYPTRNTTLRQESSSIPLTGSLEKLLQQNQKTSSQNLEVSPQLLDFMKTLSKTHEGPVTMLNLLHFQHPEGKKSYYQYGQAFIPVAGKRGGSAKLVGNVVRPSSENSSDSRGPYTRPEQEWWNEISIVHYPSIRHFCDMLAGEDYQGINEKYRLSALKDTFLLCTTEFDVETGGAAKL